MEIAHDDSSPSSAQPRGLRRAGVALALARDAEVDVQRAPCPRRRHLPEIAAALMAAALGSGCGAAGSQTAGDQPAVEEAAASLTASSAAVYTGALACSSDDLSVGVPFTVTQSATNVTGATVGPIVLGVRRLGFAVEAVVKPRTGICRIAGSATCNSVVLGPGETQTYTLTLVPLGAGAHSITGWASSSYVVGGSMQSISFTVK